jgi:hypothetical protein
MLKRTIQGVVIVCVSLGIVAAAHRAWGQAQTTVVYKPANELTWEPLAPGAPVDVVPLWGDRTKGSDFGMFLRLKAGQQAGMHAHTADYYGVNVKGIWVREIQGDPVRKELPQGSYVFQPGKQFHNDICKGPEDCVLLIHQHAISDVIQPPARR